MIHPRSQYQPLLVQAASTWWDPILLEAQVWQESSDQADAFRYEPGFYRDYIRGKQGTPAVLSRSPLAACSYGLLQILYTTARERGFLGFPEQLFDPQINLTYGVRQLDYLRDRFAQQRGVAPPQDHVLAAYNAGLGNWDSAVGRDYVARVRTHERQLRQTLQEGLHA